MRFLTKLGLIVTALWLIIFGIIVGTNLYAALNMGLNEWGDFLAGLSAPLALLWLVIGYFQQGEELRLNTEALKSQQEELRRQVEETAILAKNAERQARAAENLAHATETEAAREELRLSMEAQPNIVCEGGSSSGNSFKSTLRNIGGDIRDARSRYDGPYGVHLSVNRIWKNDTQGSLKVTSTDGRFVFPFSFEIDYLDKSNIHHTKCFELSGQHSLKEVDYTVTDE